MSAFPGFAATQVGRRALLGGAGLTMAATLAGCRPDSATAPPTRPKPDPDVALTRAVLVREQAALDLIEAVVARFPSLAGPFSSAVSGHRAHVRLLRSVLPHSPSHSPSPSATPSPSPSTSPSQVAGAVVPQTRTLARSAVVRQETRLVPAHRDAALAARAGRLARLLASMGAAAAQQAAVLGSP